MVLDNRFLKPYCEEWRFIGISYVMHQRKLANVRKQSRAKDIATARASQVQPVSHEYCISSHVADVLTTHPVLPMTARISPVPQIMPPAVPSINEVSALRTGIPGASHIVKPTVLVPGIDFIRPKQPEFYAERSSVSMPLPSMPLPTMAPSLDSVPGVDYVVPPISGAAQVDYVALLLSARDSTR